MCMHVCEYGYVYLDVYVCTALSTMGFWFCLYFFLFPEMLSCIVVTVDVLGCTHWISCKNLFFIKAKTYFVFGKNKKSLFS